MLDIIIIIIIIIIIGRTRQAGRPALLPPRRGREAQVRGPRGAGEIDV